MTTQIEIGISIGCLTAFLVLLLRQFGIADRAQAELRKQFFLLQDRLAAEEPAVRANAALRLAEMGQVVKPGAWKTPSLRWRRPYTKTFYYRSLPFQYELNEANFSRFLPAVALLVDALHREKDPSVRAAVKRRLESLITFTKQRDTHDRLLTCLLNEVAEVNRLAKREFIRMLAEYAAQIPDINDEETLRLLGSAAPFCRIVGDKAQWERDTRAALQALFEAAEFEEDYNIFKARCTAEAWQEQSIIDAMMLPRIAASADVLMDTRDIIAAAIRALQIPFRFPSLYVYVYENGTLRIVDWRRETNIELRACFLAGINLNCSKLKGREWIGAHLQGADLANVYLQGADLHLVQLDAARLEDARLRGSNLNQSSLNNASMNKIDARECNFRGVELRNAWLAESDFRGSNMYAVRFQGAVMHFTQLQNTELYGARFEHAEIYLPQLQGAKVAGSTGLGLSGIAPTLLEADFEDDTELRERVIAEYNSRPEAQRRAYEEKQRQYEERLKIRKK